jgi:hypothetical protein
MSATFDKFKASAFLLILAGYLVLNYPFMQLRIPPVGFGIPMGELLLAMLLLTVHVPHVLSRMNAAVFLLPFLLWWSWGSARLIFDFIEQGFWTFRDSTQLIESFFLIACFALAGQPRMMDRLLRWLRAIILISCLYGLLFIYQQEIVELSPTLPGGSEQDVPIFAAFGTTGTMLLWGAGFCLIQQPRNRTMQVSYFLLAGFLVAFAVFVLQTRTIYLQLLSLAAVLLLLRPRAVGPLTLAIPVLVFILVASAALDLRISGRLTSEVSLSFYWDHFQSIFGFGGDRTVAAAAEGADMRLRWWSRLYDRLTADEVTLITGLGYGIPLTDFRDMLGVITREPHNSIISVTARLGLLGGLAWIWMQVELFRAGVRAYRDCRRMGRTDAANFILLVLIFAVLTLAGCFGEDIMEKPYNAIPYYVLWGFVLRIAYQLRAECWQNWPALLARDVAGIY